MVMFKLLLYAFNAYYSKGIEQFVLMSKVLIYDLPEFFQNNYEVVT